MAAADELVKQIPTAGYQPPTQGTPIERGAVSRNVNNSLNALGGMGVVASVPLRVGQAASRLAGAAGPALQAPTVMDRIAGPARAAADFVAGPAGVQSTNFPRLAAPAGAVPQLPAAVPGLAAGAQANRAAAATRMVAGGNAALGAADQQAMDASAPQPVQTPMANQIPAGAPTMAPGTQVPGAPQPMPAVPTPPSAGAPPKPGAAAVMAGQPQARPDEGAMPGTMFGGGKPVAGTDGVFKMQQDGRTLYTNVPDPAQNAAMLNPKANVMGVVPAGGAPVLQNTGNQPADAVNAGQTGQGPAATLAAGIDAQLSAARQAAVDRGDAAQALASFGGQQAMQAQALGATPQASVMPDRAAARNAQFDIDVARGRADQAMRLSPGRRGTAQAQVYAGQAEAMERTRESAATRMSNDATTRSRDAREDARAGQRNAIDTARLGIDAQRAGSDARRDGAAARLADTQAQAAERVNAAQQALQAARTPEERQQAAETLRQLTGKEPGELYSTNVLQDPLGGPATLAVTNRRDGSVRSYGADGSPVRPAAPALPPRDQLVVGKTYPTARGDARWDGKQFVPVAAPK